MRSFMHSDVWRPLLLWPTSTILRPYAHCCSAELRFFSAEQPPSISRLCRVFFSATPSIFQVCWTLFCSAKHFSSMLITWFPLPSIFLLYWALKFLAVPSIFSHAKHFSALPIISLLCLVVSSAVIRRIGNYRILLIYAFDPRHMKAFFGTPKAKIKVMQLWCIPINLSAEWHFP